MALPKARRLSRSADIRKVFSHSVSAKIGRVVIKASKSKQGAPRFAVVVSKTVEKSAVKRNRIRRLLQEGARGQYANAGARDVVLIALPGVALKNAEDASEVVRKLFTRIS